MATTKKIALVTGAGSGIGKHIALALLRNDYSVVLAGRRVAALEETMAVAGALGAHALPVSADVSDPASVKALFEKIREQFGRLDLLFNNAGIFTKSASLEDVDFAQWKASVDVNLSGAFLCTQEAFRIMKAQTPGGGRIINNGSIAAHVPRPNSVAYTATKHAITGLTKATSLDGRKYNIACGQIDIGNAATDMTERMEQGILQANGQIAVEPTMSVENVANAVLYMASLPLDANVQFMTVMATNMPFIGRG
ncbi:NADP-dependent 3-hydroxy acid dehydrogenase YdfG [Collimonas sp. OK607]|uniref:SDR family oxidoreductase n=1 Tax=Collimonas sp. OK607 TaxID=1798194 RepID=UPI0008EC002E|nr:SDR family oxidoreductase [Collimonas sp. OK607]SFA74618.1 NADP-dependent 3-hydroxy acid dehydrogenase YdfG [Collimonas sp. OK607]